MAKGTVERIDTGAFDDAISSMKKALECYTNARKNMINVTEPVVESWKGEGAESFKKVYRKLKTEMEDEESNLKTIKEDLESIRESYEGWDSELASKMS